MKVESMINVKYENLSVSLLIRLIYILQVN